MSVATIAESVSRTKSLTMGRRCYFLGKETDPNKIEE